MSSRLYGDWDRVGVKLESMMGFTKFGDEKLRQDAETLLGIIKGHIYKQDLPWVPLNVSTVRAKGNELVYLETGELVKDLTVIKGDKNSYFVGAPNDVEHEASGLKLSQLMFYLEYGTEHIPGRPLIAPSYEEFLSQFQKTWWQRLIEFFRR